MPSRRTLAEELVKLKSKHAEVYAREKELKSALIKAAADAGENFKETIEKVGVVKVSAPKDKTCKGTAPEIVVDAFLKLPQAQQDKLTEKGVVIIAEQWSGAYYGSVSVELF
jgi:hypothetical protein